MTDSGFVTPKSIGEREGEGQQMQKRAVMPFRPSYARRDRPTMDGMQIFPPNVPMVGGRITYETLVDLPVYRQPKNGGLGGKLWQKCMNDARLMVSVMRSETRRGQVRKEMISALRDSAVDGDLEGCDLLELNCTVLNLWTFKMDKRLQIRLLVDRGKVGCVRRRNRVPPPPLAPWRRLPDPRLAHVWTWRRGGLTPLAQGSDVRTSEPRKGGGVRPNSRSLTQNSQGRCSETVLGLTQGPRVGSDTPPLPRFRSPHV
uniref:Uncharacterized protein n=1 Tax=Chromera velia CCMP2878 TaxID=1169474 RepID=A0A0G4I5D8_9ALVE|eukprot:Cvel_11072.t1-p1 / transcript=Cvel_11072.t1 / gene=Cvel_11072 / organism=Chromera_velia_CCMP2878 / gene_product=hypothetical protein / transcript_product=hypothetical protein / location=Cvel_scaffold684:1130-10171(-) / protein_length=257 / sequence_SO=supercontig / SO=protein_coding / is_pseudo=false